MTDTNANTDAIFARIKPGYPRVLDVPDEWLPALVELDARLAAIDPDYQVVQVKEKFGSLRYYVATKTGKLDALLALVRETGVALAVDGED